MNRNPNPDAAGIRLIILYKLTKSVAQVAGGVVLFVLTAEGLIGRLHGLVATVGLHAVEAWKIKLMHLIANATLTGHMEAFAGLLVLDGLLSGVEGWSLRRHYSWGRWLVIFATGTPLPFEIAALIHRLTVGRVILCVGNAAIVIYLVILHRRRAPGLVLTGGGHRPEELRLDDPRPDNPLLRQPLR